MKRGAASNDTDVESDWSTASEDDYEPTTDGPSPEHEKQELSSSRKQLGNSWSGSEDDEEDSSIGGDSSDDGLSINTFLQRLQDGKGCVYLRQGVGGIYTFPQVLPKDENLKTFQKTGSICTIGCLTYVGVYIPIDDRRCFAAHIDGSIYKPLKDRDMRVWQIIDDVAVSFRKAVRAALDQTFHGMQQEVKTIQQRQDLKDRIIVVCTWPVVGEETGPGFHIIEVLCEYFHLDKTKFSKYSAHHGFIVNHFSKKPKSIQLVGWTRPGPSEKVLDGISRIADNCTKPLWGENFRSVFRATYEYVMPTALGWIPRVLKEEEEKPWIFDYDHVEESWSVRE